MIKCATRLFLILFEIFVIGFVIALSIFLILNALSLAIHGNNAISQSIVTDSYNTFLAPKGTGLLFAMTISVAIRILIQCVDLRRLAC